ncbi:4'-phosphopantetheinyl transferase [Streptomyces sp. NBC_01408]|uniref:4'-phosphopantetheinyl transferase family protein n=1 Tax=Streptomyces sp. NBC_01408 TaxID=2903855 RepID=UPI00225000ED|nr:4'-phosphopantetheinyl transferase superfamily protein [Streptomyces sp. NBC_01408]MCX4696176.1 4'-phosphopantetheinyl transferase superfamily protein [Streptomyces sp. NBC_01408]
MIEEILPPNVVVAEAYDDSAPAELYPEEARVVANSVDSRRREFATARLCARRCLAQLGLPPGPLLPGRHGAPRWPESVTGSISHCTGYRVAALARTSDVAMIGIDAEPDQPLPAGVLESIALPGEIARLRRLRATEPGVCWDRLLFSMKEAVYKAWYPATGHRLDFEDADIEVDAAAASFTARIIPSRPQNSGEAGLLKGRWLARRNLVVSAIAVPKAVVVPDEPVHGWR